MPTICHPTRTAALSLLIFLLFRPISTCFAATYYVDFASGNDAAQGTTTVTAWKHAPGDSAATGAPAATLLAPGDIVRFKGGVIYLGSLEVARSGSQQQSVIYEGATNWGTGRAIFDKQNQAGAIVSLKEAVSYITFRNLELRNAGGYADNDPILSTSCSDAEVTDPPGGTGLNISNGGNQGIKVENSLFHRLGNWRNSEPFSGANSITGTGIAVENASNVSIIDCEFTKMRVGISLKATTTLEDIDVARVKVHDYVVWGIDVAPRRAGAILRNIAIRDSKIYDYHQFDAGNWQGCGEKPHSDGIFLRTASMASTWESIRVFGNEFYADNPENSLGGTASIYVSQGPSVDIFNNTFRGDKHTRSIGIGHGNPSADLQTVRIYNNSFLRSATPVVLAGEDDPTRRAVDIVNNIFIRGGAANSVLVNHDSGVPPRVLNRNIYWDYTYGVTQKYVYYSSGYRKFADLQALGYEAEGLFIDPGYLVSNASPISANDLHIAANSAAKSRGSNFSSVFSSDKDGNPRPSTGAWDIGAYQTSSGGSVAPRAPQNLKIE